MDSRLRTKPKTMRKTYQLNDTPDKDGRSYDENKENKGNIEKLEQKNRRKLGVRKGSGARKGLSKQKKNNDTAGITASLESPPSFVFKTAKSTFRLRKKLKLKRRQEEDERNKKRVGDLVAYFKKLDEKTLETI